MARKNGFLIGTIAAHKARNYINKKNKERIEQGKKTLTKEQERRIKKGSIKKAKKEVGIMLAIGITAGVTSVGGRLASLNDEMNNKINNIINNEINNKINNEKVKNELTMGDKRISFKEKYEVEENNTQEQKSSEDEKNEKIMQKIVDDYNQKYSDDLSEEKIKIIKSNPQYLGIDENGKYVNDYKAETKVADYITSGIGDVYIVLDDDKQIIASLGKVKNEIENINTKWVQTIDKNGKRIEYGASENVLDLSKNINGEELTNKEITDEFNAVKYEYEKAERKNQNMQQQNEKEENER